MGLVVRWYDFICFGIVGGAFVGAVYVIWRSEGSGRRSEGSLYESLVVTRSEDTDHHLHALAVVGVTPRGHVSSAQLWSSCWRGLHPLYLLGLRFASFVILTCFLAWDLSEYGPDIYIYYTEWTFTLVIFYFAIGTIVSAYGCAVYYSKELPISIGGKGENTERDAEESVLSSTVNGMSCCRGNNQERNTIKLQSRCNREFIQQRAGFWGYLMQTAYQTCAGAVIMTDLVFWCIIVPFLSIAHFQLDMLMGLMHTLNIVFLLLDAAVNSLPFPWFRLAYFVLWSCCYVIYQWVLHACGYSKTWPYPFLELSTPWAPLWYICLAVAHIPCYGLYSLLIRAKNSYFPRLFPEAFVKTF